MKLNISLNVGLAWANHKYSVLGKFHVLEQLIFYDTEMLHYINAIPRTNSVECSFPLTDEPEDSASVFLSISIKGNPRFYCKNDNFRR